MVKKISKGAKSKRMTTKLRNNIKKRVREHERRTRKEARKLSALGIKKRSKKNKELHIPNMYPYKKQMIEHMENMKSTQDNKRKLNKLLMKEKLNTVNMEVVKGDHEAREEAYLNDIGVKSKKEKRSKKHFMKELRNVIDESDIILEVLDARDPDGCRCRELEAEAQGSGKGKKIILVLNKIDLVPMPVVEAWKKRLEREYACVLFKANTQNQKDNLGSRKLYSNSLHKNPEVAFHLIDSSKAVGPDKLLELIKNYSKVEGTKTGVTVGVIGYPNVGKSSLINSMKKRRAVGVSGTAGFTTNLQTVEIDKMVKIVDSPGVILSNENETTLVLRNTVNAADVKDPITPISEILNRISKEQALKLYKIADFRNATQFLVNIAQTRGKFKKGGVADIEGAARLVIDDWNAGRVNHFVPPPGFDPSVLIGVRGEMEEEVDAMDDSVQMGAMVTEHDAGTNQMEEAN